MISSQYWDDFHPRGVPRAGSGPGRGLAGAERRQKNRPRPQRGGARAAAKIRDGRHRLQRLHQPLGNAPATIKQNSLNHRVPTTLVAPHNGLEHCACAIPFSHNFAIPVHFSPICCCRNFWPGTEISAEILKFSYTWQTILPDAGNFWMAISATKILGYMSFISLRGIQICF